MAKWYGLAGLLLAVALPLAACGGAPSEGVATAIRRALTRFRH